MMTEIERVEVLIKKAGSGRELARRIGTSSSSITKLKTGQFHIIAYADRIADAFMDLNCRWLLTGKGEPFADDVEKGEIRVELRELRKSVDKLSESLLKK